METKVTYTA
ncbi:hypothetical protein HaLaN_19649, partial [Haematococcus lacustris]